MSVVCFSSPKDTHALDRHEPHRNNRHGYTTDDGWVSDGDPVAQQHAAYRPPEWNYVDLHRENNSIHGVYINNPQDIPEAFQELQRRQVMFDTPEEHNVNFIAFGKVHVSQSNDYCLPPRYQHRMAPSRPRLPYFPPGCRSVEPQQPWHGPAFTPPYWQEPERFPYEMHPPVGDPSFRPEWPGRPSRNPPGVAYIPPFAYPPWYTEGPRQPNPGAIEPPLGTAPLDEPLFNPFPQGQPTNPDWIPRNGDSNGSWGPPSYDQPLPQEPGQWYPNPYDSPEDPSTWGPSRSSNQNPQRQPRRSWAQPRSHWQSGPSDNNYYARPRRWTTMAPEPEPRRQDWGMTIYARQYEPDSIHQQHARDPNARPYAHRLYGGQADVGHTLHGGMM